MLLLWNWCSSAWCTDVGNCIITGLDFYFVEYEVSFLISSDKHLFEVDFVMYFNGYTSFIPFIFKWLWGKIIFIIILFYTLLKFILHTHHRFASFFFSNSLPPLPFTSHPIYSSSVSFHEGQVSHGLEESVAHQVEIGQCSSPCIKTAQGNPA